MSNEKQVAAKKSEWTKPELTRLGTIRDIAQRAAPVDQAFANKKS